MSKIKNPKMNTVAATQHECGYFPIRCMVMIWVGSISCYFLFGLQGKKHFNYAILTMGLKFLLTFYFIKIKSILLFGRTT